MRVIQISVAVLLIMIAGCTNRIPVGEVAGKVTFEGKPVTKGTVSFLNPNAGTGDEAPIQPDGSFAIKKPLPVGEYKVSILPLIVRKQVDGKGPEVGVELPALDIPDRYRTTASTELTASVKEGKNDVPLNMKR